MSNRKLYMLKVACARLHNLKLQERKYKGALVKRACMHLLTKQAYVDTYENENAVPYNHARKDLRDQWQAKADWNSGFWGTALGKFLRPYFENQEHYNAYAKLLTQYGNKRGAERERLQRDLLNQLGVDPKKHRELMDLANSWTDDYETAAISNGDEAKANRLKGIEEQMADLRRQLGDAQADYKRYGGKLPDEEGAQQGPRRYGGPGWTPRRSGYLTDMQTVYDPEFARAYGLNGGTHIVNNYYYGADGKPRPAGAPDEPGKPSSSSGPDPALPGLDEVLDPKNPGSHLSGLSIDPKKISLTAKSDPMSIPGLPSGLGTYSSDPVVSGGSFGSSSLTTTGNPVIDVGSGLSLDPLSISSSIAAPMPEPSSSLAAIDTGSTIGHDLLGIFPGGDKAVDAATDWTKATYDSLPDWGKNLADTAVTGISAASGTPKSSDPTNPLYIPSVPKSR